VSRGVVITSDADEFLEALVICRRAKDGELEVPRVPPKPLDVALHQAVGLLLEYRRIPTVAVLSLLRRVHAYADLSRDELVETLRYVHSSWNRPLWLSDDGEQLALPHRRENSYRYYFENLSTIPDERRYPVVEEDSGMLIGYLDEAFVLDDLYPGVKFVFKGSVWIFRRIEAGRVLVCRAEDPTGAIPSWVGEDLPVPQEVAAEVGRLRRLIEGEVRSEGVEAAVRAVLREYPYAGAGDVRRAVQPIREHVELGIPVGTDRRVVIEGFSNYVMIHACAGTLVNRTLSRLLAQTMVEEVGLGVMANSDPYRIVLKPASVEIVERSLRSLLRRDLRDLLLKTLPRSGRFGVRILQVAKRMGLISKAASLRELSLRKIVEAYEGTPVYREAVSESLTRDYDVWGAQKLASAVESGEIEMISLVRDSPSPLAWMGLRRSQFFLEILPPESLERILLQAAKARILGTDLVVVCPLCWSWWTSVRAKTLLESKMELRCPSCGSRALAAFSGRWASRAVQAVEEARRRGRPAVADSELADRAFRLASLTERFGSLALVAAAAREVDPESLRSLLSRHREADDDFFRELTRLESESIRRRFL